jgi:hypothetical protein
MFAMDDLRYPIGKFQPPAEYTSALRATWIEQFTAAPAKLRDAIRGLTPPQLATPYRDGGWTPIQVVHHLADSHMNMYVRFKQALTDDEPVVSDYNENAWALLPDARSTSGLETSLVLLESLHTRLTATLRSLRDEDWPRTYRHSARGPRSLDLTLGIYAWHGRHHVAHITALRTRMGW